MLMNAKRTLGNVHYSFLANTQVGKREFPQHVKATCKILTAGSMAKCRKAWQFPVETPHRQGCLQLRLSASSWDPKSCTREKHPNQEEAECSPCDDVILYLENPETSLKTCQNWWAISIKMQSTQPTYKNQLCFFFFLYQIL